MSRLERLQEFFQENKFKIIIISVCAVILLGFGIFKISMQPKQTTQLDMQSTVGQSSISQINSQASSTTTKWVYVDIKGQVNHPGVYKLASSARVNDVIKQAGGVTKQADCQQVNLACKLFDQMLIYIPSIGEEPTIASPALISQENQLQQATTQATTTNEQATAQEPTADSDKINLNTATKEQLEQLTGIGDKKADLILQYRSEHGSFKSIDEIKNVSGIGDKTFEAISGQLTV